MRFGPLLGFKGVSGLLGLCHCKYALGGVDKIEIRDMF